MLVLPDAMPLGIPFPLPAYVPPLSTGAYLHIQTESTAPFLFHIPISSHALLHVRHHRPLG